MTNSNSENFPQDNNERLKIMELLDKATDETLLAGSRSRRITLLLCFAGVLAFMAAWNSREKSWARMRYTRLAEFYPILNSDSVKGAKKDTVVFAKALTDKQLDYLKVTGIDTKEEIEDLRKLYVDLKREIYLVKVPILGITFDINDLGMFSGITFSLLMLLLWFVQEREEENLNFTLKSAYRNNLLNIYYTKLWMGQVLMVPPAKNRSKESYWPVLLKALYFIPLLSQVYIFWNDWKTHKYGAIISEEMTEDLFLKSLIFLLLVGMLTSVTIGYTIRKERIWMKYRNRYDEPWLLNPSGDPARGSQDDSDD
jgi:hypothetical protein